MNQNTSTLRIRDIPEELLVEIFKWISFDDLHSIKLVCKKWQQIASTTYLNPYILDIPGTTNPQKVFQTMIKYGNTATTIKFHNALVSTIVSSMNLKCYPNVKILSMKWRCNALGDVRMPVVCLNWIIDQCPKLHAIELQECFIYGDLEGLLEKIRDKGIYEITLTNKYLFLTGMEKFFYLKDIKKFIVFCHFVSEQDVRLIKDFCQLNSHSLINIGLRIENLLQQSNDEIISSISSCKRLKKLQLTGKFNASDDALRKISELTCLRELKIDITLVSREQLVKFFRLSFSSRLSNLKIIWNRHITQEELLILLKCKNLIKLTFGFIDIIDNSEISEAVMKVVKHLRLRKLKVITNICFLDLLLKICLNSRDIFYINFIQFNVDCEIAVEKKLKIISRRYAYECFYNLNELRIVLRKKVNT